MDDTAKTTILAISVTGELAKQRLWPCRHRVRSLGTSATLLAEGAILVSDGGGKAVAALNPAFGRDRVQRFLLGIARRVENRSSAELRLVWINRLPGFVIKADEGVSAFAPTC